MSKRKVTRHSQQQNLTKKKDLSLNWDDEDIRSDDGDDAEDFTESKLTIDPLSDENSEQKRKRLARSYLSSLRSSDDHDQERSSDVDDGVSYGAGVSEKLRKDRLDTQGKYFRSVAESLSTDLNEATRHNLSGHKLSVTCVTLSSGEDAIFSGSKDNSTIQWDTETGRKIRLLSNRWRRESNGSKQSYDGEVLSIASTFDGRYVASGLRDGAIKVYDLRMAGAEVKTFTGHRDAITSLCFRRDSYSLFSGSYDRCIKHWDLQDMGYLETMFGHQDKILGLDCWTKARPISCSSDRTLRVWKVQEESHLVLRSQRSSIDAVQMMTDDSYISGGQDGSVCLWNTVHKKALATAEAAHGFDNKTARWITSVGAMKMTDLAASGSFDGYIRLWRADATESKNFGQVASVKVDGFVNAIAMSANLVVAGCGNEHKLGRWWHLRGNLNKVAVIRLKSSLYT